MCVCERESVCELWMMHSLMRRSTAASVWGGRERVCERASVSVSCCVCEREKVCELLVDEEIGCCVCRCVGVRVYV